MVTRERLLALIAEEKENYSKYFQLCTFYQIQPDPLAQANHRGKLQILQNLLLEKNLKS